MPARASIATWEHLMALTAEAGAVEEEMDEMEAPDGRASVPPVDTREDYGEICLKSGAELPPALGGRRAALSLALVVAPGARQRARGLDVPG
jgi:hypothetical protein